MIKNTLEEILSK